MNERGIPTTEFCAPIHIPVMAAQVVHLLSPSLEPAGSYYLDATCGLAGHAVAVLQANPQSQLIGIDQDAAALALAEERLSTEYAGRFQLHQLRFDQLAELLDQLDIPKVQAILADLGVSSMQLDQAERGFSYSRPAPLDMRMNTDQELTAEQLVNTADSSELSRIFTRYGEQPAAGRIANAIITARPITDSAQLAEIVAQATPAALKRSGHPAKRVFQALRIAVNDELAALTSFLPQALAALAVGGRLAVLSYHSLEDRLVKQAFAKAASDNVPSGLPMVPNHLAAQYRLITTGASRPDQSEIAENPRAKAARLRVIERVWSPDERTI